MALLFNEKERGISGVFSALMRKVYTWMTLALLITGVTAYGVASQSYPADDLDDKPRFALRSDHRRARPGIHHYRCLYRDSP